VSAAALGARGRQHLRDLGPLGTSLALHLLVILLSAFVTLSPPFEPPAVVVELLYEQPPAAAEGPVTLHPEPAEQQAMVAPVAPPPQPETQAAPEPKPPVLLDPEPAVARPGPLPDPVADPLPEPALPLEPAPPRAKPRMERAAPQPLPAAPVASSVPAEHAPAGPSPLASAAPVATQPIAPPSAAAPVPAENPPGLSYGAVLLRWLERYREYPRAARLRRIEGVVVLRLTIERSGRLAEAAVAESSGSPLLDDAALAMARRAAPMPPLPRGEGVERVVMLVPIAFRLG